MYVSFNETVKVMSVAVTLDPPKPFTKLLRAEPWVADCDDRLVSPGDSLDALEKRKPLRAPRIEPRFPGRLPRSLRPRSHVPVVDRPAGSDYRRTK